MGMTAEMARWWQMAMAVRSVRRNGDAGRWCRMWTCGDIAGCGRELLVTAVTTRLEACAARKGKGAADSAESGRMVHSVLGRS